MSFDKGCGTIFTTKVDKFVPLIILVLKILSQGRQEKDIVISYVVKKALSDPIQRNPKIYFANIQLGINWFSFDSIDEFQICENMGEIFRTFVDAIAGDDKLFEYSVSGDLVRQVISKLSRVSL